MSAKITICIFSVLLLGLAAFNLLLPDKAFSENENRYLAQRPAFSVEALFLGSYTEEFDTYITDQFVLRDAWVGLKTIAERALGRRSASGVYFADDGYLIEMFDDLDEVYWEKNLGYVRDFSEKYGERGLRVSTMLIPTASLVLEEKLPGFAPEVDQRALLSEAAGRLPGFVDVSGALGGHKDEYIFYRTDHHWTTLGAFCAYNCWRGYLGEAPRPLDDFDQTVLSDAFYGTTYSKASLYTASPDTITAFVPREAGALAVDYNLGEILRDSIYETSYLEAKDKYSVFLNANQSISHISTQTQNGRRLLIVKDSYANAFVQLLTEDYEEIYVVDLRYFKASIEEFIAGNGITDALVLYNIKGFSTDPNLFFLLR